MAQHVGDGLKSGSAVHHPRDQCMPQSVLAVLVDAGALKQVIHAIPDVNLITLLGATRTTDRRLACGIEEAPGVGAQTAQIGDEGFAYILRKWQRALLVGFGPANLHCAVLPIDVCGA